MKRNILHKIIAKIFIPIFIVICALGSVVHVTYAVKTGEPLNLVEITIDENGNVSQNGDIFGAGLWYPGKENKGIIRINNEFEKIEITNLGLQINLQNYRTQYGRDIVHNSLAEHMKFTGSSDHILKNKSFRQLEYSPNNEDLNGYPLNGSEKISIGKGDSIGLNYTLLMDEEAGNELEEVTAKVILLLNAKGDTPTNPPGGDGGGSRSSSSVIQWDWSHDCIKTLLAKGVINGYPSIKLHPETSMTRAEVAVVLANSLKLKPINRLFSGYRDSLPKWARGHIIAVSDAGVFKGYPVFLGHVFKPDKNITREEIVTVLIRAFSIKSEKNTMLQFTDTEDISDWAYEYVKIGVERGVLVGYPDKSFKPQNYVSRAEAFTIVCKLLGYHDEHIK